MKRIGEDVAKKLDDPLGVVIVERPIRGKGACAQCDILGQAPVEAHIIERCSTTAAKLAQVRVAKFSYHWPLPQEAIFERTGFEISRSTLVQRVGSCGAAGSQARQWQNHGIDWAIIRTFNSGLTQSPPDRPCSAASRFSPTRAGPSPMTRHARYCLARRSTISADLRAYVALHFFFLVLPAWCAAAQSLPRDWDMVQGCCMNFSPITAHL